MSAPLPPLTEATAGPDPLALFSAWFTAAVTTGMKEPAAMALATATPAGEPSVRMVLLRGFDERGFDFFTNYQSRKASELDTNPRAALSLYWPALDRQVRIEGTVTRLSPEESDTYFRGRPIGSQLGALASPQSEVIPGREVLEEIMDELTRQYSSGEVPRPAHWGGYRVYPHTIEFWQARDNRLHDRFRFTLEPNGTWRRERLAP